MKLKILISACLLALLPFAGHATITHVGGTGLTHADNATTFTATRTITAGNSAVLTFAGGGGGDPTPTSVVDNTSTAWTVKSSPLSADGQRTFTAYRLNCPSGVTSVTASGMAAGTFTSYGLDEYSSTAALSLDQFPTGTTGANPLSTASITNATNGELVLAVGVSDDNAVGTWGTNSGYTTAWSEGDTTAHTACNSIFEIAGATTGPFSAVMNYSVATTTNAAMILSFKEPGGATPVQQKTMLLGIGARATPVPFDPFAWINRRRQIAAGDRWKPNLNKRAA